MTAPLPVGPCCPGSPLFPEGPVRPFVALKILPGNPGGPCKPELTTEFRLNACQSDSSTLKVQFNKC